MNDVFELREFAPAPSVSWPNRYRISLKGSEINVLKFKSIFGTKIGSLWKSEDSRFSYSFYLYSPSKELVELLEKYAMNMLSTNELLEKLGVSVDFETEISKEVVEVNTSKVAKELKQFEEKTKQVSEIRKNVKYIGIVSEVEFDVNSIIAALNSTIKEKDLTPKIERIEVAFVLNFQVLGVAEFDGIINESITKNVSGIIVIGYSDTDIKILREIALQNNIKFLKLKKQDINKRFWCLNFIVGLT